MPSSSLNVTNCPPAPAVNTNCLPSDHNYSDRPIPVKPIPVEVLLSTASKRIEELEARLRSTVIERFGLERFSSDPNLIEFYTGFHNYQCLYNFFAVLTPYAVNMKTWSQIQRSPSSFSQSCTTGKLLPIDQLFLFLYKLRVGALDQDLADKFQVSQSTVNRNTVTWANLLYVVLGSQPLWPSREQVNQCMPDAFKESFPSTRIVLSCSEIAIQTPSSMVLRSGLYSRNKEKTLLKCLFGVTPAGAVSFVSSLYAGSISDKHLTKTSGILNLLDSGDGVMTDKDFLIEDLLAEKQCSLVVPHFSSPKGQSLAEEASHSKLISNLRVHVEGTKARFKEFHLFDSPIPLTLAGFVDQLWTVACLLTNFQSPIISNFR